VRHSDPYIYENQIVTAQQNSFSNKVDYNIVAFNKTSGDLEWTWNHNDPNTKILSTDGFKNFLFVRKTNSVFLFDIESRTVLWEIHFDSILKSITFSDTSDGNNIYLLVSLKSPQTNLKTSQLRKYSVISGEYEIIYEETEGQYKPYRPGVRGGAIFLSEDGSEKIVLEVFYISDTVSPRETLPDLVCVDLKTKEIVWRKTDYNELSSSFNTIKYHKGKLYNTGDWSLYEFDPETGEELNRWQFWESYPLGSFNNCDFTIVDDVVYTLDDLGHLNGINTVTGWSEFSYQKGAARTTSPPTIHNDLILYSSLGHELIEIFDTKKQAFIHKERNKSFGNEIVYDEEIDMYFTTTFMHFGFMMNSFLLIFLSFSDNREYLNIV